MNGSNNAGGKINLSGTYGLGLDMEPWAYEARGRRQGRETGRQEGYSTGYSSGYSSGIFAGNDEGLISGIGIGRQIAWNRANAIIDQLRADFNAERNESNRAAVAVNALRMTVETLIKENPRAATHIRKVFMKNYNNEIKDALCHGDIDVALHMDPFFKKNAPKMYAFIMRAL